VKKHTALLKKAWDLPPPIPLYEANSMWRNQQGPDLTSIKVSKLEAAVRKIGNDAHRLWSDLNRASGDGQNAWDYEGASVELGITPALAEELRRIIDLANEWHYAQPKGESGRPANSALRCLIKVYDNLHRSGHRRTSLRRFLELCRDHLNLPLPEGDSLEKAITRYRREVDKTSAK
jgi:hypothetical protein